MHAQHSTVALFAALFVGCIPAIQADTIRLSFEISHFVPSNGNPPPTDPAGGAIFFHATGLHAPVDSIDSINLTLDGNVYTTSELGFDPSGNGFTIGGTLNGVNQIRIFSDDFFVEWDPVALKPNDFAYSSSQRTGIWDSRDGPAIFTSFSLEVVPEPAAVPLLLIGLLGLLARCRINGRSTRQC